MRSSETIIRQLPHVGVKAMRTTGRLKGSPHLWSKGPISRQPVSQGDPLFTKSRPFRKSPCGPSRRFVAVQHLSRTWSEADINWQAKPADSVENDPMRTLADLVLRSESPGSEAEPGQLALTRWQKDLRPRMRSRASHCEFRLSLHC